jgi:phage tail-like protein
MVAWDWALGDAAVANSFGCTVGGTAVNVREVTGLKWEFDMIEVKTQDATGKYFLRKIPGRQKPVTVTITRALTTDTVFTDWMKKIEKGATDRREVVVTVFTPGSTEAVKRFTVMDCQPSSVEVTQVAAGATNTLDEKITLQGYEIKMEKG